MTLLEDSNFHDSGNAKLNGLVIFIKYLRMILNRRINELLNSMIDIFLSDTWWIFLVEWLRYDDQMNINNIVEDNLLQALILWDL